MAKKPRKVNPASKILTLNLPAPLHRRFMKEARKYEGDGGGDSEKFIFLLMEKYLAISKKKNSKT